MIITTFTKTYATPNLFIDGDKATIIFGHIEIETSIKGLKAFIANLVTEAARQGIDLTTK